MYIVTEVGINKYVSGFTAYVWVFCLLHSMILFTVHKAIYGTNMCLYNQ